MRIAALVAALVLAPALALAQPANLPKEVQAAIEANKKECGEDVKIKPAFVAEKDVNGDGVKDYVLDYGEFACGDFASFFCGTGGCLTQVFASLPGGGYAKALDQKRAPDQIPQGAREARDRARPARLGLRQGRRGGMSANARLGREDVQASEVGATAAR